MLLLIQDLAPTHPKQHSLLIVLLYLSVFASDEVDDGNSGSSCIDVKEREKGGIPHVGKVSLNRSPGEVAQSAKNELNDRSAENIAGTCATLFCGL